MDTILNLTEYSEHIGVLEKEIRGHSRKYEHKIPRYLYWLYLNKNGIDKRSIAQKFNIIHFSIMNCIKTIKHNTHLKLSLLHKNPLVSISLFSLPFIFQVIIHFTNDT